MNRELIVNVNPTEISIALCEDKVLVELNKEQCQTGFASPASGESAWMR